MNNELLIYGALALLAIIIIISIIKKAIKLVITIAAIIVLISAYNVFVKGVSPIEEFNAYKTNIQYTRDIASYTGKIKTSVGTIKDILENKKADEASQKTLKEENAKLIQYQKEVSSLKHTDKLNVFHNTYTGYLGTIVATTDSAVKISSASSKTMQGAEEVVNKLKTGLESLSSLKVK